MQSLRGVATCRPEWTLAYFLVFASVSEQVRLFATARGDRETILMQVWPAIDLRGGNCVRLEQGDYGRETVFGEDPAAMARRWGSEGAEYLHLVDLDGARDG